MDDTNEEHRSHPLRTVGIVIAAVLALLIGALAVIGFTPLLDPDLGADPAPAATYEEAMESAAELGALDGPEINPLCHTQVLTQGRQTERAVVLLHGYTNCPQQFAVMAQAYFDAGYNVVMARIPEHGYADRLTRALSDLSPASLTDFADSTVDIAAGLGEEVSVVGLSAGGTLAAWLGNQRDEVTEVALLAPLMVPKILPDITVGPVARIGALIPDIYLWWDNELQEELASPPYAYPRYSVHSLAALLAVGRKAQGSLGREEPLGRVLLVTNENDAAVSNSAGARVADRLTGETTQRDDYVFTADEGYKHDVVDPQGENAADLEEIYGTLGPLLGIPNLQQTLIDATAAQAG